MRNETGSVSRFTNRMRSLRGEGVRKRAWACVVYESSLFLFRLSLVPPTDFVPSAEGTFESGRKRQREQASCAQGRNAYVLSLLACEPTCIFRWTRRRIDPRPCLSSRRAGPGQTNNDSETSAAQRARCLHQFSSPSFSPTQARRTMASEDKDVESKAWCWLAG